MNKVVEFFYTVIDIIFLASMLLTSELHQAFVGDEMIKFFFKSHFHGF